MKYWMKFVNNDKQEVLSLSDLEFMGKDLDIPMLKQRFNEDFVKNKDIMAVKISFMGNNIRKSFICGIRDNEVKIIDMKSKEEYTPKMFSEELSKIEQFFSNPKQLAHE